MTFRSILFDRTESGEGTHNAPPAFFGDLNLDQLVNALISDFKAYDLAPFYYTQLANLDTIFYRQQVMRDLEDPILLQAIRSFSEQMKSMREHLFQSKKAFHKYAIQRHFLSAVELYSAAVKQLALEMRACNVQSDGLTAFRDYLSSYVASLLFHSLESEMQDLTSSLAAIRYCLLLKEGNVTIRNLETESDYSASIEETFEKFRRDTNQKHWVKMQAIDGDNHIQSQVMNGVEKLYPETFAALETFCANHSEYVDRTIAQFDREVQFYVAFLVFMEKLRAAGLSFCEPKLSKVSKEVAARNSFDIVLAGKLTDEKASVVCNDFHLVGSERIFVVSGPNHGGKTTFARMFGQMHYLASLGLPVPGTEAKLFLFDRLFTHFEREEKITSLRGKLQDDLIRIRGIVDEATPNSVVIMNEIFSSTTLKDALYLSRQILVRLSALDLLCVCVTFLEELASFNEKAVSVVGAIDSRNPAIRTFKIERRPADGLAYALAVAQKHGVTYEALKGRIRDRTGDRIEERIEG